MTKFANCFKCSRILGRHCGNNSTRYKVHILKRKITYLKYNKKYTKTITIIKLKMVLKKANILSHTKVFVCHSSGFKMPEHRPKTLR